MHTTKLILLYALGLPSLNNSTKSYNSNRLPYRRSTKDHPISHANHLKYKRKKHHYSVSTKMQCFLCYKILNLKYPKCSHGMGFSPGVDDTN